MKKLALILAGLILAGSALAQSVVVPATQQQIAVAGTVAARTKIVSGATGKSIYVTAVTLVPVATSVVTFSYGTGTDCATGTTVLAGVLTFAAGQTLHAGSGNGAVIVVPPGNDLCITIATAAAPGFLAYALF